MTPDAENNKTSLRRHPWWRRMQRNKPPNNLTVRPQPTRHEERLLMQRSAEIKAEMTRKKYYKVNSDVTPIDHLPHELLIEIFSYLRTIKVVDHTNDLLQIPRIELEICMQVSSSFAAVAREMLPWRVATFGSWEGGGECKALVIGEGGKGKLVEVNEARRSWRRRNHPCIIMGAQLHRSSRAQYLRLFIDTRGGEMISSPFNRVHLIQSKFHSGFEYNYPIEWKGTNIDGRYRGSITFQINTRVPVDNLAEFTFYYGNRVRMFHCKLNGLQETETDVLPMLISSEYCGIGGVLKSKYGPR